MTIAYWCVLVAAILPLIWAGAAKSGAENYDNASPRAFMAALDGWHLRADWAQQNAYEAFPPFAAGVIIAHVSQNAAQGTIDLLAGIFILSRILHGILYITDRSTARSLVWLVGFGCMIGLFIAAV